MLSLYGWTAGRTDRGTTVKQYAPDLSMRGHKNAMKSDKLPNELQSFHTYFAKYQILIPKYTRIS